MVEGNGGWIIVVAVPPAHPNPLHVTATQFRLFECDFQPRLMLLLHFFGATCRTSTDLSRHWTPADCCFPEFQCAGPRGGGGRARSLYATPPSPPPPPPKF